MEKLYLPFMAITGMMTVITFFTFGIDKYFAVKNKWRIRESTLFLLSALFGAVGGMAGMYVFRHKTKKTAFTIVIPALAVFQAAVIVWVSGRYFGWL